MSGKARILYIEDEVDMIELSRMVLEREGYEVIGAVGGSNGLEAVKREKPDLILLDLMMPDVDGWQVYRHIKADQELADIPVIIITAKAQTVDKTLGLHIAKVEDYITKPFGPTELIESVERVLNRNSAF
jgi:two-component system response regulator VicR